MINQAVLYMLWIRCLQDPKEFHRLAQKLYPDIDVDDADSIVAEYFKKTAEIQGIIARLQTLQAERRAELNRAYDVIEDFMEGEPG